MKALVKRVARVGDHYVAAGCPTCRAWPAVALVGVPDRWEEGDPLELPHPPVCPRCGRDTAPRVRVSVGIDSNLI